MYFQKKLEKPKVEKWKEEVHTGNDLRELEGDVFVVIRSENNGDQ